MQFNMQKLILYSLISIPFFVAALLFCYVWIYTPYLYELDVEKVKNYSLNNSETVEERVNSIINNGQIKWVSGEFFPCATLKIEGSKQLDLCFVILEGVLYARTADTLKYFPELRLSDKTMH